MLSKKLLPSLCCCLKSAVCNIETQYMCRTLSSQVSANASVSSKWSASSKTHDWNRAVLDAEKMVGHPTTFFSLKCLLSEEFTSVAMNLRKLVGTDHPILKTAKRLIYHGRTNMQTRGLIVLLLSKAAGHTATCMDLNSVDESGVTTRQQTLAEITEMIHTAHLIHKGILNLSPTVVPDENTREDLQLGNKISILSGDYLLANACKGLANLRNCKVVDHISKAIADFTQAEFLGEYDKQGNPLPIKGMNLKTWEEKNMLSAGSLLANSCKSTLELAGFDEQLQAKAFEFGKNIGLAWQVYSDLQPFVDSLGYPPGNKFDLTSIPVIFHLEKNQDKVDRIKQQINDNVLDFDFKTLHESIMTDDSVQKSKDLLQQYSQKAEDLLPLFGTSPATKALSNIINSLRE
ncbi:decaprenyl-diphosphate synthase subunit 2 [Trichonephila inaurata madagascariensis]|uniref:Decaprenyl-diphosphate synthase subunit 2 n=1 Tax=Trichonephila inaurata madagascariensis TaxID=2747483 RepID=A0A8X6YEJ6_9ARAC|nr:decaprenyl-diphosphate synthase subunit 2 [Trichonephila inaurata madagascariensis]